MLQTKNSELYPTLDSGRAENEAETLVFLAQHHNQEAAACLLSQYHGLLAAVARKNQHTLTYEDVYQEACLAFMEAIYSYQSQLGIPFAAYAAAKVRGDVRTVLRRVWREEARTVKPSSRYHTTPDAQEAWEAETRFSERCTQTTGRFSGELDFAASVVNQLLCADWLQQSHLSSRERTYIEAMMRGATLQEIAHTMCVSPETVKTWRKRALLKLRNIAFMPEQK